MVGRTPEGSVGPAETVLWDQIRYLMRSDRNPARKFSDC